ncbi:hypothetical protein NDU88_000732 [Pleurodeles waltl]|uniref:Uncharacterized protein n=1 Tax=Pleurodeles waltl TaxID=8319 RepID=A0AAV7P512_PLEWA|nr:hypothetical protein NDU88_000732 [Pleurodeles waltl]
MSTSGGTKKSNVRPLNPEVEGVDAGLESGKRRETPEQAGREEDRGGTDAPASETGGTYRREKEKTTRIIKNVRLKKRSQEQKRQVEQNKRRRTKESKKDKRTDIGINN